MKLHTFIAGLTQGFGARLCSRPSANNDHSLRILCVPLGRRLHRLDALQLGLASAHLHLSGVDLDLKLVQAVQTGKVLDISVSKKNALVIHVAKSKIMFKKPTRR